MYLILILTFILVFDILGIMSFLLKEQEGVINSVVECLPYKQKVTGSNPVLPILIKGLSSNGLGHKPSKFIM